MTEYEWDQKLNIDTIESDYINKNNIVVDYGCAKGRKYWIFYV